MTGHLAMLNAVTAASPAPMISPTRSATGPLTTIASRMIVVRIMMRTVTAIWSGLSFQNLRPSSTS
jgi:hypothetical protein